MEHGKVFVEDVTVGDRMRSIDDTKVAALAESMKAIGLQHPISVWSPNDQEVFLVAGAHRLAAAQSLGWESIPCVFVTMDENARRRWEIAENLHRADLTALQRDEHVAEWVRLTDEATLVAQSAPLKKTPGKGQGSKGGIRAAARDLGIERTQAQRAIRVDSLSPTAKAIAREMGLDNNRSALLDAAKHDAPDEQVAELRRKAEERARRQAREHAEVKDTKADAREILADAIVEYVPESRLADVTAALALLGLKEVAARIQSLTGAVFDRTDAGQRIGHA